jgi:hypothetical protein
MPKNTVSDPITDQEMTFAHLILSGSMNDRRAAEAAGLNPQTAAYTKAKPRVRDYMIEHRAAIKEKLVDQEVDRLRKLNLLRDQVLARLWELAALSQEATRGSIAGQIKALAMIAAIEGLIPDRRLSPSATQPAAPPLKAQIYQAAWLRKQQQEAGEESGDPVAAAETQPGAPHAAHQAAHPESAPEPAPNPAPKPATDAPPPHSALNPDRNFDRNQPNPAAAPLIPTALNRLPDATNSGLDVYLDTVSSSRQPFSIRKNPFARRRR